MKGADLRQLVHLASGGGACLLYYWDRLLVAGLVAGGAVLAAVVYKLRGSNPLHRQKETPLASGATWYAVGVVAALLLFPPEAAFVGWLVLAAGDSVATLVGMRVPIWKLGEKRSLGGLLGFAAATIAALAVGLSWWHPGVTELPLGRIVAVAVTCALAESLVPKVDDNVYLPTLGAGVYWALG